MITWSNVVKRLCERYPHIANCRVRTDLPGVVYLVCDWHGRTNLVQTAMDETQTDETMVSNLAWQLEVMGVKR